MISRDFCKEQIARLSQFDGYPRLRKDEENHTECKAHLRDLVDALQCSPTTERAKAVVDGFVSDASIRRCPLPADIRRAAYAIEAAKETYDLKPTQCGECGDSGYRMVRKNGYEFAEKCTCKQTA